MGRVYCEVSMSRALIYLNSGPLGCPLSRKDYIPLPKLSCHYFIPDFLSDVMSAIFRACRPVGLIECFAMAFLLVYIYLKM